jgi:protein-S-isoprenylcysteine O-methyltransferase Ste14
MLTVLALAGALAASPRRRRTLLQMTIGGTLALLAVMTVVSWGQSSLIDRAAPRYQAVASVLVHAFTTGFFTMTTWCVAGGVAVTAIALLSRPCRWTTAIRAAIRIEPDRDHGRPAHLPARPRPRRKSPR